MISDFSIKFFFLDRFINYLSVQTQVSHSMMYTQKTINPFNFTDLSMASEVRTIMFTLLVRFDQNRNNQFEEEQIKDALIKLLDQDPSQISYVTRNVFRYDLNNDGIITYEEFVNFCVEQHFGELAIQRLHRSGAYQSGARLKMNLQQFTQTLEYALSFIKYTPSKQILAKLFKQIGPNEDQFITYVQYFQFLKHYFGSKSEAAGKINVDEIIQKIEEEERKKKESKKENFRKSIMEETKTETPQSDFNLKIKIENKNLGLAETGTSRHPEMNSQQKAEIQQKSTILQNLMSHQVILSIMKYDEERCLSLTKSEAEKALKNIFRFQTQEIQGIVRKIIKKDQILYEDLLERAVEYQMCVKSVKNVYSLDKSEFALKIKESMVFLRAKPIDLFFEQIFLTFLGSSNSLINEQSYSFLMEIMFKKDRMTVK